MGVLLYYSVVVMVVVVVVVRVVIMVIMVGYIQGKAKGPCRNRKLILCFSFRPEYHLRRLGEATTYLRSAAVLRTPYSE